MVLRLPNPTNDVERMLGFLSLLCAHADGDSADHFGIDYMVNVAVETGFATARGAVGQEALRRSEEKDRSRDPLFNNLKMMSEVYRILGWLRPAGSRSRLRITVLGRMIGVSLVQHQDMRHELVRQSLLGIVFPNPTVDVARVVRQRPFRSLLLLADQLGGVLSRDEIVLGLTLAADDSDLESRARRIAEVREAGTIRNEVDLAANSAGVQPNTLRNYTRFPRSLLASPLVGWGAKVRRPDLFGGRGSTAIELTPRGLATADWLKRAVDLREPALERYALDCRASFASYAFYTQLVRAGVPQQQFAADLNSARATCSDLLEQFEIGQSQQFLYSPCQQAPDEVLRIATGGDS